MKTTRPSLFFALLWAGLGAWLHVALSTPSNPKQIRLQISETVPQSGIDRVAWPVTNGIPFPKGVVKNEQQVALFDASGKEVPLQTTVLSRYWEADSSIRWLLLDFQAEVPARGTAYYTVRYGKNVTRHRFPSELSVVKLDDVVNINTGMLRFSVSKDFLTDIEVKTKRGWQRICSSKGDMTLSVGAPPNPEYLPIVTGEGRNRGHYSGQLDPNLEVVVEDAGPLRAQVKVEGWHVREDGQRFGPFTLRVNAFAGKPYLQVYYTFVNSDLPERGLIKNVGLRLPLGLKGPKRITYGSKPIETVAVEDDQASYYLLQEDWNRYKVVRGEEEVKEFEGQSEGWLDVSGDGAGVVVVVRNCAQMFPKEIKVQGNELSVWIYPEDGVGPLDLRRGEQKNSPAWREFKEKYPKAYGTWVEPVAGVPSSGERPANAYKKALVEGNLYYLSNHSALGFSRTHEVYFFFHGGETADRELARFAKASDEPLRAFALDRWYDYTNALGHLGWKDTVNYPLVENYFAKKIDWAYRHQNGWFPPHFWGIVSYGGLWQIFVTDTAAAEWGPPNQWSWYLGRWGQTTEVDAPKHLLLYYLRSNNGKAFKLMESCVLFMMDVMTAHANLPDFEPVNTVPNWKKGGTNRQEYDPYGGGVLENHTWNEGLIDYYYLTGHRRAYDVAMAMGDFALRLYGQANRIKQWRLYEHQFDRNSSNNWRILLKCYELTGQERFKEEALKWREFFLNHSPRSYNYSTFMTVRYLVPTYALDYRLFGDERVAEEIMNIARWLTEIMEVMEKNQPLPSSLPSGLTFGKNDPYQEGFLAPALSFDITRGGGPLEDLLKKWWKGRIAAYQRQEPFCTAMNDFTEARWNEFAPLFFFLRACREANITGKI